MRLIQAHRQGRASTQRAVTPNAAMNPKNDPRITLNGSPSSRDNANSNHIAAANMAACIAIQMMVLRFIEPMSARNALGRA